MLVFDNINEPKYLSRIMPHSRRQRGAVLCTTQNNHLLPDDEGKRVTLSPFDHEQGALFLTQRLKPASTPLPDTQLTAARATSTLLGGLPLFLAAVADFLYESGLSVCEFVERYDEISNPCSGARKIAGLESQLWDRYVEDHSHVFEFAFQKLSPRARETIGMLALLDGVEIAESLVFSQHKDEVLDFLRLGSVSKYVHR